MLKIKRVDMSSSRNPDQRLKEIAELAEFVAEDSGFSDSKVDPFEIAKNLKIPVFRGDYRESFDGLLEHKDGRFFIYYDSARLGSPSNGRVRFTIAHELGHWHIDEHRLALEAGVKPHCSWTDYRSSNPVEREADHFAANLLMPWKSFKKKALKINPNLNEVLQLSEDFGVSWTSVVRRYVESDIYACGMVVFDRLGNKRWSWISDTLADNAYRTTVDSLAELAKNNGSSNRFRKALEQPSLTFGGIVSTKDWFRYASKSRIGSLYEEMRSLGSFGVLVFLSSED